MSDQRAVMQWDHSPTPADATASAGDATEAMPWHHCDRLPVGYRSAWDLFVDWCQTTGQSPLPATSSTLLAFLQDCPAAPSTQAVRVRAVSAAHVLTDHEAPERTPAILEVLRGRPRRPDTRIPIPAGHVDKLLTALPVHGWTAGWFGRRDRVLLVLADTGQPYRTLARLAVGDVDFTPTGATITPRGTEPIRLDTGSDPTICRPCALVLWIRALQLAVQGATVTVARAVDHAKPLTRDSPHYCRRQPANREADLPLLTVSDSWGHIDVQPSALSPRSLSRLARTDQHWNHRDRPLPRIDDVFSPEEQHPLPTSPRLDPIDLDAAVARRHATIAALAPLTAVLDDLHAAADALEQRTAALLAQFGG